MDVQVPTLNNILPSSVSVYALSLLTTNGDEIGDTFNENNYEYNQEKGILTIIEYNILSEIFQFVKGGRFTGRFDFINWKISSKLEDLMEDFIQKVIFLKWMILCYISI